jgi:alpha-tubulin suppressor-like RCC1 family protein
MPKAQRGKSSGSCICSSILLSLTNFYDYSKQKDLGVKVVVVTTGKDFTLMLMNSGRVYAWGANKRGQLGYRYMHGGPGHVHQQSGSGISTGLGPFYSCPHPKLVESTYNHHIKQIGCGLAHAVMLSETGISRCQTDCHPCLSFL